MPRRFFRKFAFKRQELSERWFMTPFRHLLHDNRFWSIRRRAVAPAFAWGVFVAFLPIPGHMIIAALGGLVLHCNLPVAVLATFVVNPLTIGPIYYFTYRVGAALLSIEPGPFSIELSIEWMTSTFASVWEPLLLGSVLVGAIAALIGYVFLDVLWRYSVTDYKTKKQRRSGL